MLIWKDLSDTDSIATKKVTSSASALEHAVLLSRKVKSDIKGKITNLEVQEMMGYDTAWYSVKRAAPTAD